MDSAQMAHELTPKKMQAIAALLSAPSVEKASEVAGISKRTLWRWLREDAFKAALTQAEGEAIADATRRLVGLQGAALSVIEQVLADRFQPAPVRLQAAKLIFDILLRLRSLTALEERLARLEALYYGDKQDT
ncbi:MAG: hypothetical protein QME21_17470 [Anaerolineales bacterium]|nr:hypothetical protein [Anaerolineales bacterium]